jgi:hypothetical protein
VRLYLETYFKTKRVSAECLTGMTQRLNGVFPCNGLKIVPKTWSDFNKCYLVITFISKHTNNKYSWGEIRFT